MDCSLPGSSIHGIFQARVLEWGALPSPGSSLTLQVFTECLLCAGTPSPPWLNPSLLAALATLLAHSVTLLKC